MMGEKGKEGGKERPIVFLTIGGEKKGGKKGGKDAS